MARRTGAKNHTHRYYKMPNGLWACNLDDCTHYMPKNVASRMNGMKSICWTCGDEFQLIIDALEEIKPQCDDCRVKVSGITEFLSQKGL